MNLYDRIAFDEYVQTAGPGGVVTTTWVQRHACRVELIYQRGGEVIEAARLEGRSIYKLRVRQCAVVRTVNTAWRIRDLHRGTVYEIKEADTITSRDWAHFVIEGEA